jgi:hypothetical protein
LPRELLPIRKDRQRRARQFPRDGQR